MRVVPIMSVICMRAVLAASLLAGCAVRAPKVTSTSPASPDAPAGRLAGAPPSLRPGVADYKDVPALRKPDEGDGGGHQHHHGH